jgi:hypothetical protein
MVRIAIKGNRNMKIPELLSFVLLFAVALEARDLTIGYFVYTDTVTKINDSVTMINDITIRFDNKRQCNYQQFPWKQIAHPNSFEELVGADTSAIFFKYSGYYRIHADTLILTLKLAESRNYETNDKQITITVLRRGENELINIGTRKIFKWSLK